MPSNDWDCPRCGGDGYVDRWGDDRCQKCNGTGKWVDSATVASMVEAAIDHITGSDMGDCDMNPLHLRNVIQNAKIGPEIAYGRVLYALQRNPRATYRGSLGNGSSGRLPYYRVAATAAALSGEH